MSKYVYDLEYRKAILTSYDSCEGGQCVYMSNRICTRKESPEYGTRNYSRCSEYQADSPERNTKISKGQRCGTCRFFSSGGHFKKCFCWKSCSTQRYSVYENSGTSCKFWQAKIEDKPQDEEYSYDELDGGATKVVDNV